jgi:Na+/melibiose symporter-like transporter
LAGWQTTSIFLGAALLVALWTWSRVFQVNAPVLSGTVASPVANAMALPIRQSLFLKLLAVFMLNGIASAVPASLVMFFVEDQIQASADIAPWFLGAYFMAGVVSLPVGLKLIQQWGLPKTWGVGMLLAIVSFASVSFLGPGDEQLFLGVCIASGIALGADMVVPGALLNRVIDHLGHRGEAEGLYLGWWNLISKFNLALAAGLCLPLLASWGYAPGARSVEGLHALSLAYGVLPCVLKTGAIAVFFYFWIQPSANR